MVLSGVVAFPLQGLVEQVFPEFEVELLAAVAIILALGIASRILADRLQIPSVLFLIIAGVLVGPEGLGLVLPEHFGVTEQSVGPGLTTMVGVAVSIILFEGAFQIHRDRVREAPRDIARLVTVGAVLMWLGTAVTVWYFIDVGWQLGLLVGALLIATGPTVITPLLNVVSVRDHVSATLESEGVINDVTAAILAVVVFEVLVFEGAGPLAMLVDFGVRLGAGALVGAAAAGAVWALLTKADFSAKHAELHSRLITLAFVVLSFGIADLIRGEAGIAAAATMGIILGNVELPHREEIEEFAEDLTTIVLSFVFVALAALIQFDDILALGVAGFFVVAAVTLLVRPLLVFVSIWHERFTTSEKAFMSFVAPRGIIPASVATLFALELQLAEEELAIPSSPEVASEVLAGTVFLVIFATVVFQGGLARQIADYLGVTPMRTIIIGAGRTGQALAERLEQDGENVVLIESDPKLVEQSRERGFRVVKGDGTDDSTLQEAGAGHAHAVIATTGDDDVNLLVGQQARTKYGITEVAARVNEPGNVESFQDVGIRAIDAALATANSLQNVLERPSMMDWMNELGRTGDVREIEVTASDLVDRSIDEINGQLPSGTLVGLVHEPNGKTHIPSAEYTVKKGDRLTLIGDKDAVDRASKRLHPRD